MIDELQKLYDAIDHETTGLSAGVAETDAEADFVAKAYERTPALLAAVKAADDYWYEQSEGNRRRLAEALCALDGTEFSGTPEQQAALLGVMAGR